MTFIKGCCVLALGLFALLAAVARAETVGDVDTEWKMIGPDHKIIVDVYDDPKVAGVSCYISRAKTGGITGALGLAEDTSDASVACRQVADTISVAGPLPKKEEVFTERASPLFKRIRVVRMVDVKRNTLVYLVYSDKLVDGSPKNSITAVAVPRSVQLQVK